MKWSPPKSASITPKYIEHILIKVSLFLYVCLFLGLRAPMGPLTVFPSTFFFPLLNPHTYVLFLSFLPSGHGPKKGDLVRKNVNLRFKQILNMSFTIIRRKVCQLPDFYSLFK